MAQQRMRLLRLPDLPEPEPESKPPTLMRARDGFLAAIVVAHPEAHRAAMRVTAAYLVQRLSGTEWDGGHAMRISVSNWRTTAEDVERSAAAILRAAHVVSVP